MATPLPWDMNPWLGAMNFTTCIQMEWFIHQTNYVCGSRKEDFLRFNAFSLKYSQIEPTLGLEPLNKGPWFFFPFLFITVFSLQNYYRGNTSSEALWSMSSPGVPGAPWIRQKQWIWLFNILSVLDIIKVLQHVLKQISGYWSR